MEQARSYQSVDLPLRCPLRAVVSVSPGSNLAENAKIALLGMLLLASDHDGNCCEKIPHGSLDSRSLRSSTLSIHLVSSKSMTSAHCVRRAQSFMNILGCILVSCRGGVSAACSDSHQRLTERSRT